MMMIAVCPVHGTFPAPNFFGGTGTIQLANTAARCPQCGRPSPIPDGTYDLVGSVVKAFRAPGISRHEIEAFSAIARAERDGRISAKEAERTAKKISPAFEALLKWTKGNSALLSLLISVMTFFISIYAIRDSDVSSNQAHSDAEQIIQMQKKIYESLQTKLGFVASVAQTSLPFQKMGSQNKVQTPIPGKFNRHERRKSKAISKRSPF